MWEDLIMKAKDGGLDVIDTYVFWNGHEPSPGNVLFSICIIIYFFFVLVFLLIFTLNLLILSLFFPI